MLRNVYTGVRRSTNMVQMNRRRQFVAATTASAQPQETEENSQFSNLRNIGISAHIVSKKCYETSLIFFQQLAKNNNESKLFKQIIQQMLQR